MCDGLTTESLVRGLKGDLDLVVVDAPICPLQSVFAQGPYVFMRVLKIIFEFND